MDFLDYLGYLVKIGQAKSDETKYFHFYINKVVTDVWVMQYAHVYEYRLFEELVTKLQLLPMKLERDYGENEASYVERETVWNGLKPQIENARNIFVHEKLHQLRSLFRR